LIGRSAGFVAVFARGVPPQLPCAGSAEEVFAVGEAFQVEEFFFDSVVDGFDAGLAVFAAGGMKRCFARSRDSIACVNPRSLSARYSLCLAFDSAAEKMAKHLAERMAAPEAKWWER